MANLVKGEAVLTALGRTFIVRLDFEALCALEDVAPSLMDDGLRNAKPSVLRAVLVKALQAHQAEADAALASQILQDAGVLVVLRALGQATSTGWGQVPEDLKNPRAAAGTGKSS